MQQNAFLRNIIETIGNPGDTFSPSTRNGAMRKWNRLSKRR